MPPGGIGLKSTNRMICCGERRRRRTEVAPVQSVPCRVSCRVMTSAPRGKRARSFVQLDEIGQIIIIKSSTNNDAAQVQARTLAHSRRCTLAEREREGKVRTGRPRSHRGNRCWKNVRRSWKEPAGKKGRERTIIAQYCTVTRGKATRCPAPRSAQNVSASWLWSDIKAVAGRGRCLWMPDGFSCHGGRRGGSAFSLHLRDIRP